MASDVDPPAAVPPVHRIARFDHQRVVVIGMKDYQHGIPQLVNAEDDARAVGDLLARRHGYELIEVLGPDATYDRLVRIFDHELGEGLTERSQLLVYFAGHGTARPDPLRGLDGFLLPIDAMRDRRRWLSMTLVRDAIERLPCHHLLLILDCCFAGAFARRLHRELDEPDEALVRERYDHYLDRRCLQLLASAAHDQRAIDDLGLVPRGQGPGRSPFVHQLITALQRPGADLNDDGVVTGTDLYGFLRERLAAQGLPQTPGLWPLAGHNAGEYVFTLRAPELAKATPLPDTANPYMGLRPFATKDSKLFHGRDAVADDVAASVLRRPFTVVLGPSGSGKTSLLHAGVEPRLRGARLVGPFRPGATPLAQLTEAIATAAADDQRRTVLIVDALDDLVNACSDPVARSLFQRLLASFVVPDAGLAAAIAAVASGELQRQASACAAALASIRSSRALVVSARSDMEPHFTGPHTLGGWLSAGWGIARMPLRPMNREELRACIELPAAEQAVFFSSERRDGKTLVQAILDEVDQVPGSLPLLSVALQRMFEKLVVRGTSRTIDWREYPAHGGVVGALQESGNRVLAEAPELEDAIRQVLLRMVAFRGRETVRRSVPLRELRWQASDEHRRVRDAVAKLDRARLVVTDVDPSLPEPSPDEAEDGFKTIMPAHDALLSGWPELQGWIDADRARLQVHRQLTQAADEWKATGLDQGRLWDDERVNRLHEFDRRPRARSRLDQLRRWSETLWALDYPIRRAGHGWFNVNEQAFIGASLRARRRRRLLVAVIAMAAITALTVTAIVALVAREREAKSAERATRAARLATEQGELAGMRAMAYRARGLETVRLDAALLFAAEAIDRADAPETRAALLGVLSYSPALERIYALPADGVAIEVAPSGRTIAVGLTDGRLAFLDSETGAAAISAQRPHAAAVTSLAYAHDGRTLVSANPLGELWLWDADLRKPQRSIDITPRHALADVAITAEGAVEVVALDRWYARLVDGAPVREWQPTWTMPSTFAAQLVPGRERFVTGAFDELLVWDAHRRDPQPQQLRGGNHILTISVRSDGRAAVTGTTARSVELWDLAGGGRPSVLGFHDDRVVEVRYAPAGDVVATGGDDRMIRLWSPSAPADVRRALPGHPAPVMGLAFSPDGARLASTGGGGVAMSWRITPTEPIARKEEGPLMPKAVAYAGDARTAIATSTEGQVVVLGESRRAELALDRPMWTLPVPATDRVVVIVPDGSVEVRTVPTLAVVARIASLGRVTDAAAAGGVVAVASDVDDQAVVAVLAVRGDSLVPRRRFSGDAPVHELALSDDGRWLAIARYGGAITVHDLVTGAEGEVRFSADETVGSLAFGAGGHMLAAAGTGGQVMGWDDVLAGKEPRRYLGLSQAVNAVAIDPTGRFVAAGGNDNRLRLWDLATGAAIGDALVLRQGTDDFIAALAFRPDGLELLAATSDPTIYRIDLDRVAWQRRACAIANRSLRDDEAAEMRALGTAHPGVCDRLREVAGS